MKEKLDKREGEIIEAIEEIDNLRDEVLNLSIQLKEKVEESKENDKKWRSSEWIFSKRNNRFRRKLNRSIIFSSQIYK